MASRKISNPQTGPFRSKAAMMRGCNSPKKASGFGPAAMVPERPGMVPGRRGGFDRGVNERRPDRFERRERIGLWRRKQSGRHGCFSSSGAAVRRPGFPPRHSSARRVRRREIARPVRRGGYGQFLAPDCAPPPRAATAINEGRSESRSAEIGFSNSRASSPPPNNGACARGIKE